jgi:hypothetical protein
MKRSPLSTNGKCPSSHSVTCRWHVRLDVSRIGSVAKLLEVSVLGTDPEPLMT